MNNILQQSNNFTQIEARSDSLIQGYQIPYIKKYSATICQDYPNSLLKIIDLAIPINVIKHGLDLIKSSPTACTPITNKKYCNYKI